MSRHITVWKKLSASILTAALLLQAGPCTGDNVRDALGSGARTTVNGLFGVFTESIVTNVFNLP